jgi:Transposase DDE domain
VQLGPGNENERAHLLALLDALRAAGYQPTEVWADRGYCSDHSAPRSRRAGSQPRSAAAAGQATPWQPAKPAAQEHAAADA